MYSFYSHRTFFRSSVDNFLFVCLFFVGVSFFFFLRSDQNLGKSNKKQMEIVYLPRLTYGYPLRCRWCVRLVLLLQLYS